MTEEKIEENAKASEKAEAKEEKKTEEKKSEKKFKKPSWVKTKPADLEKLVAELYKQGNSPAKIGLILRDQHGIPKTKLFGKRIMEIVNESKIPVRKESEEISKKIDALKAHIEKNKHDVPAKKAFVKETWALRSALETEQAK